MRRIAPALALFFLAPLVAEFLLGDFPISYLFALILLAPMYGGGAIVIREVVRRTGRGWPSLMLLALAYGVFEEGITTQSLFDPNYAHAHLLEHGFIPALGIAVPWTLGVLTLHTVWSISAPIALVETASRRTTTPWLRTPGLVVASTLFVVGSLATTATSIAADHFVAPVPTLAVVVAIVVALVVIALRLPKADVTRRTRTGAAPSAWLVLGVTLVAGAVFEIGFHLPTWPSIAAVVIADAGMLVAVRAWSARAGWDAAHRFALAAGAVLTYAWSSFTMSPVVHSSATMTLISHVIFALAAVALLVVVARRIRTEVAAPAVESAPELAVR